MTRNWRVVRGQTNGRTFDVKTHTKLYRKKIVFIQVSTNS